MYYNYDMVVYSQVHFIGPDQLSSEYFQLHLIGLDIPCLKWTVSLYHCKHELVILTLVWLHEFQSSINNILLRYTIVIPIQLSV